MTRVRSNLYWHEPCLTADEKHFYPSKSNFHLVSFIYSPLKIQRTHNNFLSCLFNQVFNSLIAE